MTDPELDALDEAVARLEGWAPHLEPLEHWLRQGSYCRDWSAGGPIIERELIGTMTANAYPGPWVTWEANAFVPTKHGEGRRFCAEGPTPLVAAMRAYVASKSPEDTPHD